MGIGGDKPDPFAGVSKAIAAGANGEAGAAPAAGAKGSGKAKGECVCPVPDDAPAARTSHNRYGKPSIAWRYLDSAGRLIHWVCRFDKPDGSKEILPLTLWRDGERLGFVDKA